MNDRNFKDGIFFENTDNVQSEDDLEEYIDGDKYSYDWSLRSFEKTLDFSSYAIKCGVLFNGSAIIAILAFIGDLSPHIRDMSCIIWSLWFFVSGTIFAGISSFFAYFAQQKFTHSAEFRSRGGIKKNVLVYRDLAIELDKKGMLCNRWAIGIGILSGLFFITGVFLFSYVLSDIKLN